MNMRTMVSATPAGVISELGPWSSTIWSMDGSRVDWRTVKQYDLACSPLTVGFHRISPPPMTGADPKVLTRKDAADPGASVGPRPALDLACEDAPGSTTGTGAILWGHPRQDLTPQLATEP